MLAARRALRRRPARRVERQRAGVQRRARSAVRGDRLRATAAENASAAAPASAAMPPAGRPPRLKKASATSRKITKTTPSSVASTMNMEAARAALDVP
jgi:hypothetical protein